MRRMSELAARGMSEQLQELDRLIGRDEAQVLLATTCQREMDPRPGIASEGERECVRQAPRG
jgi:hypothetical protein